MPPAGLALDELRVRRARGLMRALKMSGEDLLGEAQRRAPIREGTLRASAALAFLVNGARFDGAGAYAEATAAALELAARGALKLAQVEVSFNTVYAARQHEETDWEHPKGGGAKYLEKPLQERAPRFLAAVKLEDELALR